MSYIRGGISRGVMNDLLRRLNKTYVEVTGKNFGGEEEDNTGNLSPFEAAKFIIAKKITLTHQRILDRDDPSAKKNGGSKRTIRINNEIKKMIRNIKEDYEKLKEIHEKNKNKKSWFRDKQKEKLRKEQTEKEASDLQLIKQHIERIESLDRAHLTKKDEKEDKKGKKKSKKDELLHGIMESGDENDPNIKGGGKLLMQQSDLTADEIADLPEIDISEALIKVQKSKQIIDEGLDILNNKLENIHDMAKTIGTELDEQNTIIDNLDKKAEKELERLKNLNKKVESAIEKVGGTQRLLCIIILLVIIAVIIGIGFVFITMYVKPITT